MPIYRLPSGKLKYSMPNTPLISVLLPTRSRTNLTQRSLRSLIDCAIDPAQLEILIAYDMDDLSSRQRFHDPEWTAQISAAGTTYACYETPVWSYNNLHFYYNHLAERAAGSWIMIWNDDAVMETRGWDQYVAVNKDFVGMLHMRTTNFKPNLTLFPVIPKAWINWFGAVSLVNLNDSWIQDICHQAELVRTIPATIFHDRFDVTGENNDSTFQNRRYQKKLFNSETMREIRQKWAQQLRQISLDKTAHVSPAMA